MATQQAQSDGQRSQWQHAFQGPQISMNGGMDTQGATLSPPLLTSQSGHRYADYTAPKLSPSHVAGTFAQGNTNNLNTVQSPPYNLQAFSNPPSGQNSPSHFQQQQPQSNQPHSGHTSPFGNAYSFQSARPPISVMTSSNPGTPSYNQTMQGSSSSSTLAMPMPIGGSSSQSGMINATSTYAYLTAGILDPTSMVYDENSGGYATPSYAGSYADDSSFDERRSHSPFDSRPDSRSPNNQDSRMALGNTLPNNATDLLAFRDKLQQGKSDWDELSSLGGRDHVSTSRSSPSGHLSSPDLGSRQVPSSSYDNGLEMAVERMFAPIPNLRNIPIKEDTLRATSAPPPALLANSAPVSARSVFTASPAQSPILRPQSDQFGGSNMALPPSIPALARFSPSPTVQGNFLQQQSGQPSLRSPPLPHLNHQTSSQENKNASLAPLAIPDKPDLTLTTATPTAIPRTATGRQDSTQAALDTVFSTFFQRPATRQDSKDSTDSGPSNLLHAEAAQALFNDIPPHDLTLDLGASSRSRVLPVRQRSKSDTYMRSPIGYEGQNFPFAGPHNARQDQQQQSSGAIDPRALDGNSPGWENFKASAMALQQREGSALDTDDNQFSLSANIPSQAGPSSRRRSVVDTSPYESHNMTGLASTQHSYLVPPSPGGIRRSQSHGASHKRGAQSEDYTASTFSPRTAQFGDVRNHNVQANHGNNGQGQGYYHAYDHQDHQVGNRFLGGGYEPQQYSQNQYDLANLPPMPSAFLSGQDNQYGLPTSSSIGNYSRQPSVDYGQQYQAPLQNVNNPGYMSSLPGSYNMHPSDPLAASSQYSQYTPAGMATPNLADMPYNQSYDTDTRFVTGPYGLLDPGRMRRRSSVRSDTSAISALSGVSDFTWESKTTEATKQAAKRRRKDPAAAKFVCEYCNETFTRAYNLKGHIRSHEGLKPFTCEVCNKGFARRHDLKRHELLHSGVKKYICEACQTPFVRLDALQRHHKSENGAACIQQIAQMSGGSGGALDHGSDEEEEAPEATQA